DYPTDADTIIKIVKYLRMGYDLVIGSRAHELSILDPPPPPLRKVIGRIFNLIVRLLFRIRIRDTQCGVKGFRKEVFSIIGPIQFSSFVFDVEIIVKAQIHGLRIKEIPIYWSDKTGSKVRVLRDPAIMFSELMNLWIRLPRYKESAAKRMRHSGK
ncbi:hypothetical protein J7L00_07055, partial [Candidatus Bathyarchaeota archaeon]|nr:hypothetical protein [Candidatus Bathyarchaeota archaeon]